MTLQTPLKKKKREKKAPLMERVGVRVLKRTSGSRDEREFGDDEIHILDAEEQAELKKIENHSIYKAAAIGAVTGFIGAVAEIASGPEVGWVENDVEKWILIGVVVGFATALELAYLYFLSLKAVDDLAWAAGIDIQQDDLVDDRFVAALARAALEVPNPRTPVFGVDPTRETSRTWLVLATLIYKAKVGLTNFILKAVLRRLLARAGLRFAAAYVAIPVLAFWDAIVIWKILREARIRVIGPSAVIVFVELIVDARGDAPSIEAQEALLGAVASCVMSYSDMHPNLHCLLEVLYERYDEVTEESIAERTDHFLAGLQELGGEDQRMALEMLAASTILTGRLRRKGRKLLERAFTACERELDVDRVKELARRFKDGERIDRPFLDGIAPPR